MQKYTIKKNRFMKHKHTFLKDMFIKVVKLLFTVVTKVSNSPFNFLLWFVIGFSSTKFLGLGLGCAVIILVFLAWLTLYACALHYKDKL